MVFQKKTGCFILIAVVGVILLGVGLLAYLVSIDLFGGFGGGDERNTPTVKISELSWPQGPYKVYYQQSYGGFANYGVYSVLTNGREKRLIYPHAFHYLLLSKSRQILIIDEDKSRLFLSDELGKNKRLIFQSSANKTIGQGWRISPDEEKVALRIMDENAWDDPDNYIPNQLYIIDFEKDKIRGFDNLKELENFEFLEDFYWSTDSKKLYILVKRTWEGSEPRVLYFSYDFNTDKVEKIGDKYYSLEYSDQLMGVDRFLALGVSSPPVETRRDYVQRRYYSSRKSPDGQKSVAVEYEGEVRVNNEVVMFWTGRGLKGDYHCQNPGWLPDSNHFVINCLGLRVVEVDTKKAAILDRKGKDVQWFGQTFEKFYNP